MKVSYNWLKEFVDFDASPEEIAQIITFQCFEIEDISPVKRHVEGVVAGKIVESKPHPDADRLKVTKVDIGSEILNIVCGAPNCREGLISPVATVGTKLGDFKVDARKLRGVMSEGMILAEDEIGISDDHDGIIELDDSFKLGTKFSDLIPAEDTILDFEITVNRPDALSHIGIAREIAAHFKTQLKMPSIDHDEIDIPASDKVSIEIIDAEYGPRYVARMVEGVQVAPSPLWMKALLHSLGQRPINNIVDITNYVLLELGHPLHAFNYHLLDKGNIIVRLAKEGEIFTTLDDQERKLKDTDLLIADPSKGVALAGVMGGANSEVDVDTKDVLIEAAYFNPVNVRKTSKRLGLITEASKRFERGADPSMPPIAAKRCAKLIAEIAGGNSLKGEVDAYPNPIMERKLQLRKEKVSGVLGIDLEAKEIKSSLESLDMPVELKSDDLFDVLVPTFRPDLEREIDLVEEVARIVGYDKIPEAQSSRIILNSPDIHTTKIIDAASDILSGLGFREAINYAMSSDSDQKAFIENSTPSMIQHPLNPETNCFRQSLVPGLLRSIQRNYNHGARNIKLFEIGQVEGSSWMEGDDKKQSLHAAFVVTGSYSQSSFDRKSETYDLFDLKGDIHSFIAGLSLDKTHNFGYDTTDNLEYGVTLQGYKGKQAVVGGIVTEKVLKHFDLSEPVYICECNLDRLIQIEEDWIKHPGISGQYQPFSRQPALDRDLSIVTPGEISSGNIESTIMKSGGSLLKSVELVDLYKGKPLAENESSLTFRLIFRAEDRTLTDEEVNPIIDKIIKSVKTLPGVTLRLE